MAFSYIKYEGNGSDVNYTFPFPYIDSTHIKVYLDDVVTTAFTLLNSSTVALNVAPASGVIVQVSRETPKDNPIVNFTDGSVLLEADLDLMVQFNLYVAQESSDLASIVIEKADLLLDAAARAEEYAQLAYTYERLANDHKDNASDSDDRAKAYKELAAQYAQTTDTLASIITTARDEIFVNKAYVETALSDILISQGLITSQASLASAILESATIAAAEAEALSSAALVTAQTVTDSITDIAASIALLDAQQASALAAKVDAEAARDAAVVAKDAAVVAKDAAEAASGGVSTSAQTATDQAVIATTQAGIATTQAGIATTQAGVSTTQAGIATTKASEADASAIAAAASADSILGGPVTSVNSRTGVVTGLQEELVSGTSIKTVNSTSLLGSGDIALVTLTGTETLTNKDLTSVTNTFPTSLATLTGSESLTNKTLTAPVIDGGYTEEVFAVTGTTPALSPTNGSIQTWTLAGASTPTAGTWAAGQSITLMVDDGTAYAITWTSVAPVWKTNAAAAPTLNTTGFTAIQLWKVGTTIYGARVGDA